MADPLLPKASAANNQVRINDLDQVADESISDSMNIAIDFPTQTLRMTWLQAQMAINPHAVPYQPRDSLGEPVGSETTVGDALDALRNTQFSYVGMIIHMFSTATPNQLGYAGTWAKLPAGHNLYTGDTPNRTPQGTNSPAVPLPTHNHTLTNGTATVTTTTTSTFTGSAMPAHTHTFDDVVNESGGLSSGTANWTKQTSGHVDTLNINAVSAGTPAGTVASTSTSTIAGATNSSGTASPTIDVRGSFYLAVIWERTA